jgi:ribonuclease-3
MLEQNRQLNIREILLKQTTLKPLQDDSCVQIGAFVHQFAGDKGEALDFKNSFLSHKTFQTFQNIIGLTIQDFNLWLEALTHSSFTHERSDISAKDYEKLEFLGDAILDTFIAENLFETMPHLKEGQMSKLRSALVNEQSLAKLSRFFNFQKIVLMGKGETNKETYNSDSVLADVFESIIAALYKEFGFEKAKLAFSKMISEFELQTKEIFYAEEKLLIFDAKTRLQEKTMALFKVLPEYKAMSCEENQFLVKLYIDNKYITEVKGPSKKKAENQLAFTALKEELYLTNEGEHLC